jgi:hypothetical protein
MSHLQQLNTTYIKHLGDAVQYSSKSFFMGFVFLIHGFFPNILVYTGSNIIKELYMKFNKKYDL